MIARANPDDFANRTDSYRERVESTLARALAKTDTPKHLLEAMQYSVLGGGKRIRPLLSYASGELCDLKPEQCDSIAAAVEFVHAYSLVHDDLPAMDDDDLRRGKPTTHKAFDEATAILAGDALQALAFEILCDDADLARDAAAHMRVVRWLARAAGPGGMVGGQALDLGAEAAAEPLGAEAVRRLQALKTGALIEVSAELGAILAEADDGTVAAVRAYARAVGEAFQIADDLLDVTGTEAETGKRVGKDAGAGKATFVDILGLE
ncbi:MAG: polyprenyl synthetase family protein, partial [Gammaproteobacteria bacterium]|nr:polyprenyl synthetase family protein [Gammaproteobacteria bacterium]